MGGLWRTLTHFFVLFKGQNYPIVLQSYCNRYFGKISEWPTWKEDLQLLTNFNQETSIAYKNINDQTTNKDRLIAWNRIFGTDYEQDSNVPLDLIIYTPYK